LKQDDHDILFLIDSCTAAGASSGSQLGIKEVIAACGFETWAPGNRAHSFTTALIEILQSLQRGHPFSVAHLHHRILEKLQRWSPQIDFDQLTRIGSDGRLTDIERRKTPIHISLNHEPQFYHKSIQISQLVRDSEDPEWNSEEKVAHVRDNADGENTDVLISVRLKPGTTINAEQIANWLREMPLLAMTVKVHGIVHTNSTLVLLALPVAFWDLLPTSTLTPCSFVAFASSPNLMFGNEHHFLRDERLRLYSHHNFIGEGRYRLTEAVFPNKDERPEMELLREWFYRKYFLDLKTSNQSSKHAMYAEGMSKLRFGHAFLSPQSPEMVQPGASGYIDGSDGKWCPLEPASAKIPTDVKERTFVMNPGCYGSIHKRVYLHSGYVLESRLSRSS
jgi:hypothetical protein